LNLTPVNEDAPARRKVRAAFGPIELAVVVPTFNERANVAELVRRLETVLDGIEWEVVFVDDNSPDGTADAVADLAREDRRIRVIRRIGRRGLASACAEGLLASPAPFLAVMDADLQHDEALLPRMLEALRAGGLDLAVGSRYVAGGGVEGWDADRAAKSRLATRLSHRVMKVPLADPMSGFFMLRRAAWLAAAPRISGIGFKILLDVCASSPAPLRLVELPYRFRPRLAGESKLDQGVAWDFLMLLLDKRLGHIVPARFVAFGLVGGLGVLVHLATLAVLHEGLAMAFGAAQGAAVLVAMTGNFALNNLLTYRDRRLRGWGLAKGWLSFAAACGVGAVANWGVASYLFALGVPWAPAACAGIVIGSVWNYAITARYTWRKT